MTMSGEIFNALGNVFLKTNDEVTLTSGKLIGYLELRQKQH